MLDRTSAPKSYLPDDLTLASVQIKKLDNGILFHQFIDDTNPVIKIDFIFPLGKAHGATAGLATLSAKMMMEGTHSYKATELQETLDHYGAHIDISTEYDHTVVSLLCLKAHLFILLPLVKSILTEPLFESTDFEKVKSQMIQRVKVNNGKNGFLATKSLRENLLDGTPYAFVADVASVSAITLENVRQFFEKCFSIKPDIIIAGDFDKKVEDKVKSLFGILRFEGDTVGIISKPTPQYKPIEIKREGSVQASIRLGSLSIDRAHPDYFKLSVANEILGGYFGSRLMKNIREDKGYTYGISASLISYKEISYQIIGADVQLNKVDEAIAACQHELKLMREVPVSEVELDTVKNYMLGKLAGHLDTVFAQAENYKSKITHGIEYKRYFSDYVKEIRAVTPDTISEISQQYFSADYCIVKVV